jgi:DNA-binding beta-propeller fold protein YncE
MQGGARAVGRDALSMRVSVTDTEVWSGWSVRRRRLFARMRWLLAFCVASMLLAADTGSAFALPQRGHTFAFAFGSQGDGQGQFSQPAAAAVNEATGDLYVADYANNRVELFEPTLGTGGELAGEQFVREFAVPAPVALAVDSTPEAEMGNDPSADDVYVVSKSENGEGEAKDTIYKFNAAGTQIATLKKFKAKGEEALKFDRLDGVAVSASGQLYVYGEAGEEEERVLVFDDATENAGAFSFEPLVSGFLANGIALDGEGDLYLADRSANPNAYGPDDGRADVVGKYEKATPETLADEGAGEQLIEELDSEQTTGVAVNTSDEPSNDVDELNDVYISNVNTNGSDQQTSTVAAFTPSGSLIQRFGAPGLKEASAIAVWDATGDVFVTDRAEDKVDVFRLQASGPPSISRVSSCQASGSSSCGTQGAAVLLSAQVDPNGGKEAEAYFEYGTASCAEEPSACTKTAMTSLSQSFSDQPVTAALKGLAPGSYHYRVSAQNALGSILSAEASFTIIATGSGLPDDRAWELVSPIAKHGANVSALTQEGGVVLAAEDGEALTYVTTGAAIGEAAEGNGAPEDQQVLATRGPEGWASQDLVTANRYEKGVMPGKRPEYEFFSPDLSLALVTPANEVSPPLLAPGISEATSYLRDDPPIDPGAAERESYEEAAANASFLAPGYLPLAPGSITFEGGSEDLSHIILQSSIALAGPGSSPGLYEWSTGDHLKYISSVEGAPSSQAALGYDDHVITHAVSDDGSRVVWSSSVSNPHLYLTDTATGRTIQLDRAQGVPEPETGGAFYQSAAVDGSKIFFTDDQKLVPGATGSQELVDLYVCEIEETHGELACQLRDLTSDVAHAGEPGAVQGLVLGASEDGSTVYLVAQGILATDENANHEAAGGGEENVYELHETGGIWHTTFIATLSREDMGGMGSYVTGQRFLSARVSPNGRYLAFMSNRSLTGYDNEDISSKTPDERLDEEVFLYDAQAASLTCVSCYPDGERPHGVFDTSLKSGEGLGLLVDGAGVWTGHGSEDWLAGSIPGWTAEDLNGAFYQSRYLDDEGRLFFNAAGPLVPGVRVPARPEEVGDTSQQVGVENVYEYEPAGIGSCQSSTGACVALISSGGSEHESAFLEATPSGNDVFFVSSAQLVPQDTETGLALYDARVCTSASPCVTPPAPSPGPCGTTEACRPTQPAQQPPTEALPSTTVTASGNLTPTARRGVQGAESAKPASPVKPPNRAQKLIKALQACRKQHPKNKRARQRCEAHAREQYGPKTHASETAERSKARERGRR